MKQIKDATPNTAIRRTLGYPRVSTREQEIAGVSLDAQAEKIGNYCRLHSLPEPILFPEVESGGEENEANRKKVAALLADVRRGDMVIVTDIDRFGRDVVFIVNNVRQIMHNGAVFVAINKGFDSRSPMAEDTLANWAVGAEQERRRIKERTEGGRKHLRVQRLLRARGAYSGRVGQLFRTRTRTPSVPHRARNHGGPMLVLSSLFQQGGRIA
ncbi:recombinase family protein [Sorangium sp. So ce327]|uniref:recombinase family protein n=1 Tax=Sorangium sp. So ce327 TaxID=3133301 RepID=UPI003F620965